MALSEDNLNNTMTQVLLNRVPFSPFSSPAPFKVIIILFLVGWGFQILLKKEDFANDVDTEATSATQNTVSPRPNIFSSLVYLPQILAFKLKKRQKLGLGTKSGWCFFCPPKWRQKKIDEGEFEADYPEPRHDATVPSEARKLSKGRRVIGSGNRSCGDNTPVCLDDWTPSRAFAIRPDITFDGPVMEKSPIDGRDWAIWTLQPGMARDLRRHSKGEMESLSGFGSPTKYGTGSTAKLSPKLEPTDEDRVAASRRILSEAWDFDGSSMDIPLPDDSSDSERGPTLGEGFTQRIPDAVTDSVLNGTNVSTGEEPDSGFQIMRSISDAAASGWETVVNSPKTLMTRFASFSSEDDLQEKIGKAKGEVLALPSLSEFESWLSKKMRRNSWPKDSTGRILNHVTVCTHKQRWVFSGFSNAGKTSNKGSPLLEKSREELPPSPGSMKFFDAAKKVDQDIEKAISRSAEEVRNLVKTDATLDAVQYYEDSWKRITAEAEASAERRAAKIKGFENLALSSAPEHMENPTTSDENPHSPSEASLSPDAPTVSFKPFYPEETVLEVGQISARMSPAAGDSPTSPKRKLEMEMDRGSDFISSGWKSLEKPSLLQGRNGEHSKDRPRLVLEHEPTETNQAVVGSPISTPDAFFTPHSGSAGFEEDLEGRPSTEELLAQQKKKTCQSSPTREAGETTFQSIIDTVVETFSPSKTQRAREELEGLSGIGHSPGTSKKDFLTQIIADKERLEKNVSRDSKVDELPSLADRHRQRFLASKNAARKREKRLTRVVAMGTLSVSREELAKRKSSSTAPTESHSDAVPYFPSESDVVNDFPTPASPDGSYTASEMRRSRKRPLLKTKSVRSDSAGVNLSVGFEGEEAVQVYDGAGFTGGLLAGFGDEESNSSTKSRNPFWLFSKSSEPSSPTYSETSVSSACNRGTPRVVRTIEMQATRPCDMSPDSCRCIPRRPKCTGEDGCVTAAGRALAGAYARVCGARVTGSGGTSTGRSVASDVPGADGAGKNTGSEAVVARATANEAFQPYTIGQGYLPHEEDDGHMTMSDILSTGVSPSSHVDEAEAAMRAASASLKSMSRGYDRPQHDSKKPHMTRLGRLGVERFEEVAPATKQSATVSKLEKFWTEAENHEESKLAEAICLAKGRLGDPNYKVDGSLSHDAEVGTVRSVHSDRRSRNARSNRADRGESLSPLPESSGGLGEVEVRPSYFTSEFVRDTVNKSRESVMESKKRECCKETREPCNLCPDICDQEDERDPISGNDYPQDIADLVEVDLNATPEKTRRPAKSLEPDGSCNSSCSACLPRKKTDIDPETEEHRREERQQLVPRMSSDTMRNYSAQARSNLNKGRRLIRLSSAPVTSESEKWRREADLTRKQRTQKWWTDGAVDKIENPVKGAATTKGRSVAESDIIPAPGKCIDESLEVLDDDTEHSHVKPETAALRDFANEFIFGPEFKRTAFSAMSKQDLEDPNFLWEKPADHLLLARVKESDGKELINFYFFFEATWVGVTLAPDAETGDVMWNSWKRV